MLATVGGQQSPQAVQKHDRGSPQQTVWLGAWRKKFEWEHTEQQREDCPPFCAVVGADDSHAVAAAAAACRREWTVAGRSVAAQQLQ